MVKQKIGMKILVLNSLCEVVMYLSLHHRLAALQQRDDDKVANEQAKNNLESHIFETKDAMYSEPVVAVTTPEQRETILAALTEAGNWLEDDGYFAETSVSIYKFCSDLTTSTGMDEFGHISSSVDNK